MIRRIPALTRILQPAVSRRGRLAQLAWDTFTNTNGTSIVLHTSEVGGGWSHGSPSWAISSNRAAVSATGTGGAQMHKDVGVADYTAKALCRATSGSGSSGAVMVRYDGTGPSFLFAQAEIGNGRFRLYRFNGSSYTQLGQVTVSLSAAVDYLVCIVCSGSSIVATLDGGNTISVTETQNQSSTRVGARGDAGTCAIDDFEVLP